MKPGTQSQPTRKCGSDSCQHKAEYVVSEGPIVSTSSDFNNYVCSNPNHLKEVIDQVLGSRPLGGLRQLSSSLKSTPKTATVKRVLLYQP